MALVKVKPTSPARRGMVKLVNPDLYKGRPFAGLVEKKSKSAGRNNNGRITTRHLGGGHKQHYRVIDFVRFGSYSIRSTLAAIPSLLRTKSITR